MRLFQVFGHRQLCAKNGDLVAGGGEKVAADHPAVLALVDPYAVGRFVEVELPKPAPARAIELEKLPVKDVDED